MGIQGMDIDRLYSLARLLETTCDDLARTRAHLAQASAESSIWVGPGSEGVLGRVEAASLDIDRHIAELSRAVAEIRHRADEQRQTSW